MATIKPDFDLSTTTFRIQEINLYLDTTSTYGLQVALIDSSWELSALSAPIDNEDMPYSLIVNDDLKVTVILEILPKIIDAMEKITYHPRNQDEFSFYNTAFNELSDVYYKILTGKWPRFNIVDFTIK